MRDVLAQRWVHTEETYAEENPKRVYYLSMEFLIGRSLANNQVAMPEGRDLTDRETEVPKLSSLGLTNKEISHRIDVGVKSVETFKSRGLAKLEIRSRADLLRFASQVGWLADI